MPSKKPIQLMAHLVAGYPDAAGAAAVAQGLAEGGASFFEVQIPFSDPSADGPAIRDACAYSLQQGYTVNDSLKFAAKLRKDYPEIPVFLMAYASLVVTPGIPTFVDAAKRAGVSGLIVPDLPFDDDQGLYEACLAAGLDSIPVAAPSMKSERLAQMAALGRPWLYAALRSGITGASTSIDSATMKFLDTAASGGSKILGGFGIRSGKQSKTVAEHVYAVVAGSVFVDAVRSADEAWKTGRAADYKGSMAVRDEAIRRAVREIARDICALD